MKYAVLLVMVLLLLEDPPKGKRAVEIQGSCERDSLFERRFSRIFLILG